MELRPRIPFQLPNKNQTVWFIPQKDQKESDVIFLDPKTGHPVGDPVTNLYQKQPDDAFGYANQWSTGVQGSCDCLGFEGSSGEDGQQRSEDIQQTYTGLLNEAYGGGPLDSKMEDVKKTWFQILGMLWYDVCMCVILCNVI